MSNSLDEMTSDRRWIVDVFDRRLLAVGFPESIDFG